MLSRLAKKNLLSYVWILLTSQSRIVLRILRMTSNMTRDNKLGEFSIHDGIYDILDHTKNIETRENGFSELHVLTEWYLDVVAAVDGICGGDDGAAGLESRDDTSLGN